MVQDALMWQAWPAALLEQRSGRVHAPTPACSDAGAAVIAASAEAPAPAETCTVGNVAGAQLGTPFRGPRIKCV
jgi:hypothetical protein